MQKANIDEAKMDGFISGLNWPDAWMTHGKPGGPFVPSKGYSEASIEANLQGSMENKAWLQGWGEGLAEKIATHRVNPLISTDENARFHFARQKMLKLGSKGQGD